MAAHLLTTDTNQIPLTEIIKSTHTVATIKDYLALVKSTTDK